MNFKYLWAQNLTKKYKFTFCGTEYLLLTSKGNISWAAWNGSEAWLSTILFHCILHGHLIWMYQCHYIVRAKYLLSVNPILEVMSVLPSSYTACTVGWTCWKMWHGCPNLACFIKRLYLQHQWSVQTISPTMWHYNCRIMNITETIYVIYTNVLLT